MDLLLAALERAEAYCDRGVRQTRDYVLISLDVFWPSGRRAVIITAGWMRP